MPRAEDEEGRQEEEESVPETCHIDYHSSPRSGSKIIQIRPIRTQKRSHNALNSEYLHH